MRFGRSLASASSSSTVFAVVGMCTGQPNPDGSTSFSGTGKVTGGTGIYKGATGKLSFSGTEPKGSTVATQHVTGHIKY